MRLQGNDPTEGDLKAVTAALAQVERQQRNLVDQLADLGGSVAVLVTEKLSALEAQHQQLTAERERILGQHRAWQLAQERLTEVRAWCQRVAAKLDRADYSRKRLALDALGVQVRVWPKDHELRFDIKALIPLAEPAGSCDIVSSTSCR